MINYIAQKKSLKKFNFFCFNIYRKKKQKKNTFFFLSGQRADQSGAKLKKLHQIMVVYFMIGRLHRVLIQNLLLF